MIVVYFKYFLCIFIQKYNFEKCGLHLAGIFKDVRLNLEQLVMLLFEACPLPEVFSEEVCFVF
jgi:hypothetical protein